MFIWNKYFTFVNKTSILKPIKRKHSSEVSDKWPKQVFSGIQPTGGVTLGNYLGAILNWVKIQNEVPSVTYSIVDLHSITLPQDPKILQNNILDLTATLLACGIDPKKCTLFLQSTVPQHTQLCWQLACLTTMARLSHLPQFKEKSAQMKDIPLGLFIYPVLQAADILVHKATLVPVGEDQIQHLQLAQHLAKIFNHKYGLTFPIPHAMIPNGPSCRIRSLRDPTKKMSKSDPDFKSRIHLNDEPDVIIERIKKAVTDFTSEVYYDLDNRPGVSNLINIHAILTGKSIETICQEAGDKSLDTGKYKLVVADAIVTHLTPIRRKITELKNNPDYLYDVLEYGRISAIERAQRHLDEVNSKVGTIGHSINKFDLKSIVNN